MDVVINPKKSLLRADFAEIQREMVRAFQVIQKALPLPARSVVNPEN